MESLKYMESLEYLGYLEDMKSLEYPEYFKDVETMLDILRGMVDNKNSFSVSINNEELETQLKQFVNNSPEYSGIANSVEEALSSIGFSDLEGVGI
jgi:hypothetical protein